MSRAEEVAMKIVNGEHSREEQYEEGSDFGRKVYDFLIADGWKSCEPGYSQCEASFFRACQKDRKKVIVTSMNFLGVFTIINVSRV